MVQCWYMADTEGMDQRSPLTLSPPQPADLKDLEGVGVLYWKVASYFLTIIYS